MKEGCVKIVDYQKMYAIVCAAASDAIDLLPDTPQTAPAKAKLQAALAAAEEIYLEAE